MSGAEDSRVIISAILAAFRSGCYHNFTLVSPIWVEIQKDMGEAVLALPLPMPLNLALEHLAWHAANLA